MANSFSYRVIYTGLLFIAFPALLFANKPEKRNNNGLSINSLKVEVSVLQDTIPSKKPAEKKPEENRPDIKPDIKEVPKSRRQLKPGVVTDRIKVRPVKIPRPKIIKRTIGPVLRLLR